MNQHTSTRLKWIFVSLAALAAPAISQPANAPVLVAVSRIETGQWMLRSSDGGGTRSICVSDPTSLLQLQHLGTACSRFVIANDSKQSVIHYTCPGAGHGRTTLRVETPRLVQIESQGVSRREPFAVQFEGRRTGPCGNKLSLR